MNHKWNKKGERIDLPQIRN